MVHIRWNGLDEIRSKGRNDTRNGKRLQVLGGGRGGYYIKVTVDQLDDVRKRLDREKFGYWVDSMAISIDSRPAVTVINLGLNNDAARVQSVLDEAH